MDIENGTDVNFKYILTELSSKHDVKLDHSIGTPFYGKNVLGIHNAREKKYLTQRIEIWGDCKNHVRSNIGIFYMLPI